MLLSGTRLTLKRRYMLVQRFIFMTLSHKSSNDFKSTAKPDVYVVQANDSLSGVANQFNLSVRQLAEYNDLSVTDGLFVGQNYS